MSAPTKGVTPRLKSLTNAHTPSRDDLVPLAAVQGVQVDNTDAHLTTCNTPVQAQGASTTTSSPLLPSALHSRAARHRRVHILFNIS